MSLENLRQISWLVNEHPSTALTYVNENYENTIPLSDEFKNTNIFKNNIYINLPTQRYAENFKKIFIEAPINVEKILFKIYEFYQSNIPENDLDNTPNDIWNYVLNAKTNMEQGIQVKYIELMGDLVFFEGLSQSFDEKNPTAENDEEAVYDLILGS